MFQYTKPGARMRVGVLNDHTQDKTREVSLGKGDQAGNPGHAPSPQPRDMGCIPSFVSVLFPTVVCSSRK